MITMIISVVNTKLLFVSKKVTIKTGITKKPVITKIGKSELEFSIFLQDWKWTSGDYNCVPIITD